MRGRFRDVVTSARGRVVQDRGWRGNAVVRTAWPLMAALLRNDPGMDGILFWAVGEGEAAWDTTPPAAPSSPTHLATERERRALGPDDFAYLDARGLAAPRPTDRLEVVARFSWPGQSRVLREFGLFGGDATETPGSGYLVNYVIHPRVVVRDGETLTRRVRLTLRPVTTSGFDWLSLPFHRLRNESLSLLDGVGKAYAAALDEAGVATIGALAEAEPLTLTDDIPPAKVAELRAKARMALRSAASIRAVPALTGYTAADVILRAPATLATEAGVPLITVATLREQLAALQLALDARYLRQVTLGELTRGL